MSTNAIIATDTTISITESGLTTLRLAVQTDATDDHPVIVEALLPAAVDADSVVVDSDAGDWTIYADGTVHWCPNPTVDDEIAVGTLGIPVTDPDVVDALATVDLQVHDVDTFDMESVADDRPTVDPASLETATPAIRTPETVYERVHEYDTEPALEPEPEENDTTEIGDGTETTETGGDAETTESDVVVAPAHEAHEANETAELDTQPEVVAPSDEEWGGDVLENALRVRDDRERATENAYRFQLAFQTEDATDCAVDVLEGLLNGTTVYGANPTLPDLRNGVDVDELTVTVSSALDEDDIVGALDDLGDVTVEAFEHVDVDGLPSETIESNADEQFQLLDEAMDPAEYDEFAADVDAIETGAFDFSAEPVSFDDLVDDSDEACDIAADVDDGTSASAESDTGSESRVAERLLDELESGGVTERERVALRRRLGVDPRPSTEARIDHLQTRVEELAAYTNALEAFLDENGTARDLLEDLQGDVGALYDRTDDAATERDALDDRLDDATGRLDSLDDRMLERTTDLDERLDDVESDQEAAQERIDGVADAVSTNSDDIDHLAADVHGDVDDLVDAIESLESTVESLDDRLNDVAETVEKNSRVREKLETLAS